MKKLRSLILVSLMAFAMLVLTQTPAQAVTAGMGYTCSDSSITVKWVQPSLSSSYTINSYSIYDSTTKTYIATNIPATSTSYTKSGLSKGYLSRWTVYCTYTTSYGSINTSYYVGALYVNTTPATLSTDKFGISSVLTSSSAVYVQVTRPSYDYYSQVEFYKGNKKVGTYNFSSLSNSIGIKKDAVYKYRVRLYYTNSENNQTYYGGWSNYRYLDFCGGSLSSKYGVRGCKVTLKKVSGVKSYTVYVSTSSDTGYKKTATVTVTGKKKTVSITKIGKKKMVKGTYYYVRIVPNIKVGSKTVKSDVVGRQSFTNTK